MNLCDVCGTEWDPRSADHRRGTDCVAPLRQTIDKHEGLLVRLRAAYQELSDKEPEKEKAVLDAFEKQRNDLAALRDRFEALARRVSVLEHPAMAKVPGMKPKE